jgi:phospholipase/lecithinase/hemolysin
MKRTTTLAQIVRLSVFTATLSIGFLTGSFQAQADSEPFSAMPAFGDSLTDTGNFYRLSGGYPPSVRFCNGPLWVEYLAADLGMTYRPENNYAVAGATTGTLNSNDDLDVNSLDCKMKLTRSSALAESPNLSGRCS